MRSCPFAALAPKRWATARLCPCVTSDKALYGAHGKVEGSGNPWLSLLGECPESVVVTARQHPHAGAITALFAGAQSLIIRWAAGAYSQIMGAQYSITAR